MCLERVATGGYTHVRTGGGGGRLRTCGHCAILTGVLIGWLEGEWKIKYRVLVNGGWGDGWRILLFLKILGTGAWVLFEGHDRW